MSEELLLATATRYEDSAQELDRAAAHLRIAAGHFRADDVSRGCAHVFAAYGHLHVVQRQIDEHAEQHRTNRCRRYDQERDLATGPNVGPSPG